MRITARLAPEPPNSYLRKKDKFEKTKDLGLRKLKLNLKSRLRAPGVQNVICNLIHIAQHPELDNSNVTITAL
jgi:hypothetical protein